MMTLKFVWSDVRDLCPCFGNACGSLKIGYQGTLVNIMPSRLTSTAKTPTKASPAPNVLTTGTAWPGICALSFSFSYTSPSVPGSN